ncbi:hypothetical protein TIFTF001_020168 [Ficus carica]|uniref:Uncharacterized protein n=1 Tax=Ficus carica TaxID=3494 RepID=A0AA88AD48_FICCA|nr:hypothetical protein TIFTF001_020168 [Ficus carica]
MESINAENQVLKNQLATINTQAAYSYYYNPYVGIQPSSSNATSLHTEKHPNGNQKTSSATDSTRSNSRRNTTPTRHSTPELPSPPEGPVPPGTMNVEVMMRNIMFEEMKALEAQMEHHFSSQLHKTTTSTPGFDDLARGVRETPLTKRITNTVTPKFGSISFPRFDELEMSNPEMVLQPPS